MQSAIDCIKTLSIATIGHLSALKEAYGDLFPDFKQAYTELSADDFASHAGKLAYDQLVPSLTVDTQEAYDRLNQAPSR